MLPPVRNEPHAQTQLPIQSHPHPSASNLQPYHTKTSAPKSLAAEPPASKIAPPPLLPSLLTPITHSSTAPRIRAYSMTPLDFKVRLRQARIRWGIKGERVRTPRSFLGDWSYKRNSEIDDAPPNDRCSRRSALMCSEAADTCRLSVVSTLGIMWRNSFIPLDMCVMSECLNSL